MKNDDDKRFATLEDGEVDLEAVEPEEYLEAIEIVKPEVYLEAIEIDYVIKKSNKRILKEVSVDFGPGEMSSILGPSGAGKTTLMNTLSGRVPKELAKLQNGKVTMNGEEIRTTHAFSKFGTVAPQDDVCLPALTVYESLSFAAKLRSADSHRVEALLRTFELHDRRDLFSKFLSGGQRKRLSIALELVHSPSILLVDEPTSGIDSRQAFRVVKTLAHLCGQCRMSIVASIHQPSIESLLCFDRMIILTAGRIAYKGTVQFAFIYYDAFPNTNDNNIEEKEMLLLPRNCADEAIDQAANADAAVDRWYQFNQDYDEMTNDAAKKFLQEERIRRSQFKNNKDLQFVPSLKEKKNTSTYIFLVLLHRTFLQAARTQGLFQIKSACITSLMYGLIFFQQQNVQKRARLKLGALFLALLMNALVPGIITTLFVPQERPTLRREYFNGIWCLRDYLAARTFVSCLIHAFGATLFSIIVSYMCGLKGYLGDLVWPLILLGYIAQQIGTCFGSIFPSATQAVPAFIPINILAAIFAGFFFTKSFLTKSAQKVLYFFWYLSFYRYAFARIVTNEFMHGDFEFCDVSRGDFCPYAGYADFPGQHHVPRKVVPRDLLSIHTGFTMQWTFLIMLGFFFGTYLITFILIRIITLRP